jgi:hypothetical protein
MRSNDHLDVTIAGSHQCSTATQKLNLVRVWGASNLLWLFYPSSVGFILLVLVRNHATSRILGTLLRREAYRYTVHRATN